MKKTTIQILKFILGVIIFYGIPAMMLIYPRYATEILIITIVMMILFSIAHYIYTKYL
jgi:hypothetical protein